MWTEAVRSRLLGRGLAAALALIVCGAALEWGHMGGDDADCNVALAHHDHHAHRLVRAPSDRSQPAGHCYICHSLQLLHAALKGQQRQFVLDLQSTQYRHADSLLARGDPSLFLPSRAPPHIHF